MKDYYATLRIKNINKIMRLVTNVTNVTKRVNISSGESHNFMILLRCVLEETIKNKIEINGVFLT